MVGLPGAGKSFFASQFSEMFRAPLVDYGFIRSVVSSGQPIFDRTEQDAVDRIARNQLDQLFATGTTIVVDGGSETRTARQELGRLARANGYKILFIWVQTDPTTAKQRSVVGARSKGKQAALLSLDQYDSLVGRFTPPNATEPTVVISGKHTYATQARIILKKLSEPRAGSTPPERTSKPSHRVTIK